MQILSLATPHILPILSFSGSALAYTLYGFGGVGLAEDYHPSHAPN